MGRRSPNLEKIVPRRQRDALTRSQMMGRIRSKNTLPEVRTRSAVHALGVRFRIHVADLPGKPDLANKTRRWAIFVHGCFWHSHEGCQLASKPRSNTGYWSAKLVRNRERDIVHLRTLSDLGYEVLTVWECETRDEVRLREAVAAFFAGLLSRGRAPDQTLDDLDRGI
ncbi:very short patch repair endonuclease [Acetobacteraceae bacterium KSS8]|uniref:Very short patch repair endonuclease n=1 Tax=Endosaccharibacter trunci TaxID=2812733 RepID=A0ABT1WCG8_9PROT|nr:very short patch repair endonuclease [Acetobacteraceae bacterium KSS8]